MRHTPAALATAALAASLAAPPSSAQNALGDGRALDNNLQVGSGGLNRRAIDFRREVDFRNAIVTGNAAGGRSFRGEVGYTATDDFRGLLGSNDFYEFQRDSFYSSLATNNLTGIQSIQNSLAYSVGGQSANSLTGPLVVRRAQAGTDARQVRSLPSDLDAQPPEVDLFGSVNSVIRAPSIDAIRSSARPDLLAYNQDQTTGRTMVVSSSSLLGIKRLPADSDAFATPGDLIAAPLSPTGNPLDLTNPLDPARLGADPMSPDAQRDPSGDTPPSENNVSAANRLSPHARILQRLGAEPIPPATPSMPSAPEGADAPEDDRPRPSIAPPDPEADDAPAIDPSLPLQPPRQIPDEDAEDEGRDAEPGDPSVNHRLEMLRALLAGATPPETDENGDPIEPITVTDIARDLLTAESVRVDSLVDLPTASTLFERHMARGQELLRAQQWFYAEERFTAALAMRVGDPMAIAGRVSAQVGAGMFLSAAVNLRNLYRAYPEFIPARVDPDLLPPTERAATLDAQLRLRAAADTPFGRDAALLLAFLGWQRDQPDSVRDGLDALDRIERVMGAPHEPLHDALRAVWLDDAE